MLDKARAEARRTMGRLEGDLPVIGLEPSCLLTLRDEFRSLLPGAAADALAGRAMLLSEFLAREKPDLALSPIAATAHVHGHCHQKSFGAFPAALTPLQRVPGPRGEADRVVVLRHGRQLRLPGGDAGRVARHGGSLAAAGGARRGADDLIVADGTSCRHQIRDLGGREAVHSVRVLERALAMIAPDDVLDFWFAGDSTRASRARGSSRTPAFDAELRRLRRCVACGAQDGAFDHWAETPRGMLALICLLDQFPRNLHRGSPEAFAADAQAREVARTAVARGFDRMHP